MRGNLAAEGINLHLERAICCVQDGTAPDVEAAGQITSTVSTRAFSFLVSPSHGVGLPTSVNLI